MQKKKKVLCVCAGNTCRSPMMAALLQRKLGDEFPPVESAGLYRDHKGEPANTMAVIVLRKRGIDISDHRARWIGDLDLAEFSHIVCVDRVMADYVRQILDEFGKEAILIANGRFGGIPDPYGRGLKAYQGCLVLLDRVVPRIATRIRR